MKQKLTGLIAGLVIGSVVTGGVAVGSDRPTQPQMRLQEATRSMTVTPCVDPDHVDRCEDGAHEQGQERKSLTSAAHKQESRAKRAAPKHTERWTSRQAKKSTAKSTARAAASEMTQHHESAAPAPTHDEPAYDGGHDAARDSSRDRSHDGGHDGEHHE